MESQQMAEGKPRPLSPKKKKSREPKSPARQKTECKGDVKPTPLSPTRNARAAAANLQARMEEDNSSQGSWTIVVRPRRRRKGGRESESSTPLTSPTPRPEDDSKVKFAFPEKVMDSANPFLMLSQADQLLLSKHHGKHRLSPSSLQGVSYSGSTRRHR